MSEENTSANPDSESAGGADEGRQELPTWNRGKSKRKAKAEAVAEAEVAEGDVFTRGMADAGRAAASQGKLIVGGIVAVLAVIGGAVYFMQTRTTASAESTRALTELVAIQSRAREGTEEQKGGKNPPANPVYVSEDDRKQQYADALAAAKGTSDEEVRALTSLVEAADLFQNGKYDEALAIYDAFLAGHAGDHPMAWVAKEGRGLALEAKGDLEGALGVFEAMTASEVSERFYADMALWHQGRLLERLDRKDDAVAVYKRYLELYPEQTRPSVASDKVRSRLAELDTPDAPPADKGEAPAAPAKPEGGSAP